MKKLLFGAIGVLIIFVSGCGQPGNSTGTNVADDVEFGKDEYQNITLSGNALGMAVLPEIKPDNSGNAFISPTSLYMALAMAYNGADGKTKEEIADVLYTELDAEGMNRANASLLAMLDKESEAITLNVANSMWLNGEFQLQEGFAANNQDYFNAELEVIDVTAAGTADKINGWVDDATAGKIKDMVADPLNPDLVVMLLNAIYFNADWQFEFDEKQTAAALFYNEDGKAMEKQFMKMETRLDYLETDEFQAVALPYGEGDVTMNVFLPAEGTTLAEFTESLSSEKWESWKSGFNEQPVSIQMPKFQLSYEVELNDVLKKLGMATAFQKGANFSKIIEEDDPLWISLVKQKTFIEVDEKGTEAAAATQIDIVTESAGPEAVSMVVDRPFYIAISDEQTGAILFMGAIRDPLAAK
ncbi:serpin B [Planomicrobium koreense]|uniref:Serpin B n=1 Tax=Planococcus koreensis TaxID=112331 RepID=A0A7W8CTT5_9BACL|nr:serpin family protein [Planococcus koreensis]MBB5181201.1 serpin B [Planococcus koreensis]